MIARTRRAAAILAVSALCALGCGRLTTAHAQSVATATATVDLSVSLGAAQHRAAGILHSFYTTEPPDDLVLPLKLRSFRGRAVDGYLLAPGFYDRLKRIGVEHVQVVISDNYGYPNGLFGWPGDNSSWWGWEEWTVPNTVNDCRSRNMTVEYDVWNEPNVGYFWGRDEARYLETWRRGCQKIRSIQSDAVVVGPSISWFDSAFLGRFLTYAKDNNCVPDVLSWHELSSSNGRSIPTHVQQARDLVTSVGVNISRFSINEIIPNSRQYSPGVAVAYFAGIERTTVESACHSCWGDVGGDNGENRSLDGMLTYDTKQPRSHWWAYKAYGDVTGQMVDVARGGSPTPLIDGVAGYDNAAASAVVVIGSYETTKTMDVALTITNLNQAPSLAAGGSVYALVERIPYTGTDPLAAPERISGGNVPVSGNSLTLNLPALPPNGAYEVRLTPAASVRGSWWRKLW